MGALAAACVGLTGAWLYKLQSAASRLSQNARHALVVAQLDQRGIASVLRLAGANESLAHGELLLPLKQMNGDWVVVTNAFFFAEGKGGGFATARFGEFRVLPDGRALLVGLADETLQPMGNE